MKKKIRYPWNLLKEPKSVSAAMAAAYTLFALNGFLFLFFTPGELITYTGISISLVMGTCMILGGMSGLFSLHGGKWSLERAGIYFCSGGVLGYMIALVFIIDADWAEKFVRFDWSLVILFGLVARFFRVRGFILDPNK